MAQADSVHGTRTTNSPIIQRQTVVVPTRRRFLSVAAAGGAGAALAMTAAGSVAAAALPADPIYAVIERHKAAAAAWDVAVDARGCFDDLTMTAEQRRQRDELDDAVDDAWAPCALAGIDLIGTEPTTLAGIVAAIELHSNPDEQRWNVHTTRAIAGQRRRRSGHHGVDRRVPHHHRKRCGFYQGGAVMTSTIIEFPIADRPITESEIDKLHSEAFRDIEVEVCADHELRGERRQLPRLGVGHLCRLAAGEDGERVQHQLSKTLGR